MNKIHKLFIIILIFVSLIFAFSTVYRQMISDFTNTAVSKADLIDKYTRVSSNIIEGLATYGDLYYNQGALSQSELFQFLSYDPKKNGYNLDSIGGTTKESTIGNLTGLGPIPKEAALKDDLNLALQYNEFFRVYHSHFPDIAWLYYTGENDFIFMYPWVSSNDFRYSKELKQVEFFARAAPLNNPQRKTVWTPVYLDTAGKGPMVTLSAPIYHGDLFKGVVSLDLTNAWFSKEIQANYDSYLFDDNFSLLAAGRKELSRESVEKLNNYLSLNQREIDMIQHLPVNAVQVFDGHYVYISDFEGVSWKLIFMVPVWLVTIKAILFTFPILLVCVLFLLAASQVEQRRKSEDLLAKKNDLLETTLYSIEEGIVVTDLSGRITLLNKTAELYTGWTNEEAHGQMFQEVFKNIDTNTKKLRYDPVEVVLQTGQILYSGENVALLSRNDLETRISGAVSPILSGSGKITGTVVSFRDITKEYEQEKQIEEFLELNFDMLCVVDYKGNYYKVNKKFEEILGYTSEEMKGKSFLEHIHENDIQPTLDTVQKMIKSRQLSSLVNRFECKNGTYKYIEWHAQPSSGNYIYSSARDITEQIMRTKNLETIAGRDQLTGTYNRYHLDTIISGEMEQSEFLGQPLSMAILDMDYFKNVNDTWGHPVGDEVLKHTANIIREAIRDSDILFRFGGEEFMLLMPYTALKGAYEASEKIRTAIENNPHPVAGKQTASFGVAERMKFESFADWYHRADDAMYEAKRHGRNCVFTAGTIPEGQDSEL